MKRSSWRKRAVAGGFAVALCACASNQTWLPVSASGPDDVIAVRAYEGPALDGKQVAAVYAFDGGIKGDAQWICAVDNQDLKRSVLLQPRCPNIVYLAPGEHVLQLRYHSVETRMGSTRGHGQMVGAKSVHLKLEAGHAYALLADAFTDSVKVFAVGVKPDMLLYSQVNPTFAHKTVDYASALPPTHTN